MKTIIVPTDFSEAADNAAKYAWHLAEIMSSNLKLCHAFKIPAEAYMSGAVAWPMEDYNTLKEGLDAALNVHAHQLDLEFVAHDSDSRKPEISVTSAVGEVTDIVRTLAADADCPLVVMGMSGAGAMERLIFGSTASDMIESAEFPLLLVPRNVKFKQVNKIAFATDLKSPDIQIISSLASLAKYFNAELLICYISDEKYESGERGMLIDTFLSQVTDKVNYRKIYYRHVKAIDVPHGLHWIEEHGMVDMVAMSHGQHSILDKLTGYSSFTQKLAKQTHLPLLIYPKEIRSASLVVF